MQRKSKNHDSQQYSELRRRKAKKKERNRLGTNDHIQIET